MNVSNEGVVNFHSKPSVSYRNRILSNADRIEFWLEDRASKYQW